MSNQKRIAKSEQKRKEAVERVRETWPKLVTAARELNAEMDKMRKLAGD
jgi:hypothetical protein